MTSPYLDGRTVTELWNDAVAHGEALPPLVDEFENNRAEQAEAFSKAAEAVVAARRAKRIAEMGLLWAEGDARAQILAGHHNFSLRIQDMKEFGPNEAAQKAKLSHMVAHNESVVKATDALLEAQVRLWTAELALDQLYFLDYQERPERRWA